ncbi:hypothetical protein GCM10023115_19330 [Pontixanthobacter gangjinensis]|uniref:Uncharacterized protein n=1 Tax=Pontixanthobacter gangjinensis TaxID=1028742 RepID=A0A6I4SN53_9SPHN|nr:hypothetical protein [Pontixanthobacter gangjinensis]MXO57183.1 hypothetical protein [Pontixanthobacter gangjinensis]
MMETKNPLPVGQRALVSIAADSHSLSQIPTASQDVALVPRPCVAFFAGPNGHSDRFLIQGMIDREQIAQAAQALIDVLDAIDGEPDDEEDDPGEEDDAAGQYDEDYWTSPLPAGHMQDYGPGCPMADPDSEHDGREEEYH